MPWEISNCRAIAGSIPPIIRSGRKLSCTSISLITLMESTGVKEEGKASTDAVTDSGTAVASTEERCAYPSYHLDPCDKFIYTSLLHDY